MGRALEGIGDSLQGNRVQRIYRREVEPPAKKQTSKDVCFFAGGATRT